jgi:hypothetical protein
MGCPRSRALPTAGRSPRPAGCVKVQASAGSSDVRSEGALTGAREVSSGFWCRSIGEARCGSWFPTRTPPRATALRVEPTAPARPVNEIPRS